MRELVLWGATGQARVLHEAIKGSDLRIVAVVDNREVPSPLKGIPVLHGEPGLRGWLSSRQAQRPLLCAAAVGGGPGVDRPALLDLMAQLGLEPVTIIHSTAFVAEDATIGAGCQVLAQAAVCTHTTLGRGVLINTAASVDHDCNIAAGVHIGPGARLAGEVTIGEGAFVGIGAVVLPRISIGAGATVGAGAVVTKDVQPDATVVGNPARPRT